jgi:hypothetical protein
MLTVANSLEFQVNVTGEFNSAKFLGLERREIFTLVGDCFLTPDRFPWLAELVNRPLIKRVRLVQFDRESTLAEVRQWAIESGCSFGYPLSLADLVEQHFDALKPLMEQGAGLSIAALNPEGAGDQDNCVIFYGGHGTVNLDEEHGWSETLHRDLSRTRIESVFHQSHHFMFFVN